MFFAFVRYTHRAYLFVLRWWWLLIAAGVVVVLLSQPIIGGIVILFGLFGFANRSRLWVVQVPMTDGELAWLEHAAVLVERMTKQYDALSLGKSLQAMSSEERLMLDLYVVSHPLRESVAAARTEGLGRLWLRKQDWAQLAKVVGSAFMFAIDGGEPGFITPDLLTAADKVIAVVPSSYPEHRFLRKQLDLQRQRAQPT